MRILVRSIAVASLLTAVVLTLEGMRRLVIAALGIYGSTPLAQILFFALLGLVGMVGVVGGIRLFQYSEAGRKATITYLAFFALFLLFWSAELTLGALVRVSSAGAGAAILLTRPARGVCRRA